MTPTQQHRQPPPPGALRVLVVWCPDWPVVATDPAAPEPGDTPADPVAVVEAGRVLACSDAARAAGVRRGQRLRLAQRLCPQLRLRDRDPQAEARRFESVVAAVATFTPRVEVLRPGMCAIPVKGPGRYFGGEEALAAQVHAAVAAALALGWEEPARGPEPPRPAASAPAPAPEPTAAEPPQDPPPRDPPRSHVGVADGLFAAVLAARVGVLVPDGRTAEFLAPYPVAALGDAVLAELLTRLGVETVGAFAALAGAAVADRFGPTGTAAHRLARGLEARPVASRPEGPDLTAEQLFDPPERLAEPLVFVARTLAEQLHTRLGAAGLACRRVSVEVTCADGRTAARLWRHEGRLSAAALAERVRWQLQAWQSTGTFGADGGPADGFTGLRLVPDELVPDRGRQLALWGRAVAEDRVERAVARVQSLLGYAGLRRVDPAGGRGPAEQVARTPWGEAPPARGPAPWPGRLTDPSPSVVPRAPVPIGVLDAGGAPVTVSGRAEVSAPPARLDLAGRPLPVTAWTGPWPAVEYWWDQARARRRARFQVAVADGRALLLTVEDGRWYVEGAYD
ncbi:DNA polymerase Y family protein [Kitasatospora sp. NPDC088346]|uniref:Y-family DNA polymerase n=1 Tax=Kitasatospora sp. NPDC088346 TaxID=3364073 RepID=UPI00382F5FCD